MLLTGEEYLDSIRDGRRVYGRLRDSRQKNERSFSSRHGTCSAPISQAATCGTKSSTRALAS